MHGLIAALLIALAVVTGLGGLLRNVETIAASVRRAWNSLASSIVFGRRARGASVRPPSPPTDPTDRFYIGITVGGRGSGDLLTDDELERVDAWVSTATGESIATSKLSNHQGAWYLVPNSDSSSAVWQARIYPGPGVIVHTTAAVTQLTDREISLRLAPSAQWWSTSLDTLRVLMRAMGVKQMVVGFWISVYVTDGSRMIDVDPAPCSPPVPGREPDQVSPWYFQSELVNTRDTSTAVIEDALNELLLHFSYRQRNTTVACLVDQASRSAGG
jgi:hypothetical protein